MKEIFIVITSIATAVGSLGMLAFVIINAIMGYKREKFGFIRESYNRALEWHNNVIQIILDLNSNIMSANEKAIALSELFKLSEIGRFYFPNINKGVPKKEKSMHSGRRRAMFDIILIIYCAFLEENYNKYKKTVEELRKEFSACVFDNLNVYKYVKLSEKYGNAGKLDKKAMEEKFEELKKIPGVCEIIKNHEEVLGYQLKTNKGKN